MKRQEIYNFLRMLSFSQGFYGRLLRDVDGDEEFWNYMEEQNFKDTLDIVLFLEGN